MNHFIEKIMVHGLQQEIDQLEIYSEKSITAKARLRDKDIETGMSRIKGIGIRVILDEKSGFSFVDGFELSKILGAIKVAKSEALLKEEGFSILPPRKVPPEVYGVYDYRLERDPISVLMKLTTDILDYITNNLNGSVRKGLFQIVIKKVNINNSEGLDASFKDTYISSSLEIHNVDHVFPLLAFDESRVAARLNWMKNMNEVEQLLNTSRRRKVRGGYPTIFSPIAFSRLLQDFFVPNIIAYAYREGCFSGKLGKSVSSNQLRVVDDGTLPYGVGTSPVDGEGSPTKSKKIIWQGVLRNLLHDNSSAILWNMDNTGNAFRQTFKQPPHVDYSNLLISAKEAVPFKEMLEEPKVVLIWDMEEIQGIEETRMIHFLTRSAFLAEKNEVSCVLKPSMFAIELPQLMNEIVQIGDEQMSFQRVRTPFIKTNIVNFFPIA